MNKQRLPQKFRFTFAVAILATMAGCNQGPFDIVPVSGSVTYEDGSPIPSSDYRLKFVPLVESPDGVSFPRTATAKVGADGTFDSATTLRYGDGLTYGEHRVYLKIGAGPQGKPLVPQEYLDPEATPLRVDVTQSRQLDIEVPQP